MKDKAVILFSGGLDSTTVLALCKSKNFDCFPISFNYGQKHSIEIEAAKKIVRFLGIQNHKIIHLPENMFGSSALTDGNIAVPQFSSGNKEIPSTYVPARNTIFLSIALGYAESIKARDIFLGVSFVDYSGYPDCRPEYVDAFQRLANLATKEGVEGRGIKIHTPLLYLSKAETIKLGYENGVDYSMTISCYKADPNTGRACGECDSCSYRKLGFLEAKLQDPTEYL
jgi:7-cyano-7-deazaguanine synthase